MCTPLNVCKLTKTNERTITATFQLCDKSPRAQEEEALPNRRSPLLQRFFFDVSRLLLTGILQRGDWTVWNDRQKHGCPMSPILGHGKARICPVELLVVFIPSDRKSLTSRLTCVQNPIQMRRFDQRFPNAQPITRPAPTGTLARSMESVPPSGPPATRPRYKSQSPNGR